MNLKWQVAVAAAGVAFSFTSTGCLATRKHVSQQVKPLEERISPLEDRMSKSEAKTTEQGTAIEGLETDLSRTKEKVIDVDNATKKNAEQITATGAAAQSAAAAADKKAGDARTYAENRGNVIENYIEARDQFKIAKTDSVLFGFGKSELSADAKAQLDEIAKDAANRKRFVLEVEGFTDSVGSPSVNFELSQKRAAAVVRYLTNVHKIPLRRIHLIGSGSESPIGENKTVQGRRQNRRVEVRLFAPEVENSSALTSAQLR